MIDDVFEVGNFFLKFSNIEYIKYIPENHVWAGIFKIVEPEHYNIYYNNLIIKTEDIILSEELIKSWRQFCNEHK